MKRVLLAYVVVLVALLVIDLPWLGLVAQPLYQKGIGHLMAPAFNLPAAVAFYLIYAAGLLYFAVLGTKGARQAAVRGALFGFVAYATYDLTNLATLRDWPVWLAVVDMVWGAVLSGLAAAAGRALVPLKAREDRA
jgi:uncharacterized membrane protein